MYYIRNTITNLPEVGVVQKTHAYKLNAEASLKRLHNSEKAPLHLDVVEISRSARLRLANSQRATKTF